MSKRVIRKSASNKPQKSVSAERVVRDALPNPEASAAQMVKSAKAKRVKANRVAKVVHLVVSVGDDDRRRSHADFVKWIESKLGKVPYGQPGVHSSVTGGFYILDGAVCRPEDYDQRAQTFRVGATPPVWAGGPSSGSNVVKMQEQMQYDAEHLSDDEYDKKYKIGKYAPPEPAPSPISRQKGESASEHDARMKRERAARKAAEDEDLEEFDWDESDVLDDNKMGAVADASASQAIKTLQGGRKRVVKKTTAKKVPAKKTVRRVKK